MSPQSDAGNRAPPPRVHPIQRIDFTPTLHNDTYPTISPLRQPNHRNHCVLITGASRGVGRSLALSFAAAGASHIAIAARSSLDDLEATILRTAKDTYKTPPKVLKLALDVSSRDSVSAAAEAISQTFPRLDILVNNAGYLETFQPIADSDPDEWWHTWTVNMKGPYLLTRAFLPLLLKGGEKTIVNVSSVGAHWKNVGASGYQTTKLALLRFTEFILAEYGEQGVLAFAVHPGNIATDMGRKLPEQVQDMLTDTPELAADTIAFLTKERREWLAGRYISCQWDMDEFLAKKDEIVQDDKLKVRLVV
ncbi:MAG: hypothetical protein M1833_005338 [Piccolia ochrophora]|nr:MAG: hypothetical protein M1833_005338 [Piccolia ochrophora]